MKNKILIICLFFMTLPLTTFAALDLELPDMNLPDLGSPSHSVLSRTDGRNMGQELLRKMRRTKPVVEDPELQGWIRALGNRLVSRASGTRNNFYFVIIKDPTVNAFAMPGGVIGIHSGLILRTNSESELAAVLSHEIAHVTQNHLARMYAKSKKDAVITGLGVLAGAVAASKSPDLGQAVITSSIASQMHKQLSFSRQAESEADRVGLRILASAGFNPQAMPTFLNKLEKHTGVGSGNISQYLRTHPLNLSRVSDTRARANRLGNRKMGDSLDYLYAREKLRIIARDRSQIPATLNPRIKQYANAWKNIQKGNANAVLQLLGTKSRQLAEATLIAKALNMQRKHKQTIQLLQPLVNVYHGQAALILPLAEAYLYNNQAAKAWQLMRNTHTSEQTSIQFFEVKQKIAARTHHTAEGYLAAAERTIRMGEYKHAQAVLRQASRLSGIDAVDESRLQALLNDVNRHIKTK